MKCEKCGYSNDDKAKYCENCGASLALVCPTCGSPIKPGVKFCKECGTPTAPEQSTPTDQQRLLALQKAAPPELQDKLRVASRQSEGERKPVTILFTDIVGSTSIAEKLDPEEWKEIVSGAHQRVSAAVYRYEGTVAQLLGDGVLAFFGAPITHEDDPLRAVRAALDIQEAIEDYAAELTGVVDGFQMRVGLNTGVVVVGSIGSDLHLEYLAIGDAVNLAARMQSAAQPGKVLISESTAKLVKTAFELNSMGAIKVKGKAEPVTAYEVSRPKGAVESKRGFEELYSPLVGREVELNTLISAVEGLQAGHGQIVAVMGEAGIGKSRLVEEVQTRTSGADGSARWIEGRALSYGGALSFWTITQLINDDLGLSDGDPELRVRLALRRRVKELFGEKAEDVLPYLAHLLGVRLEDELVERVQVLDSETLKHQSLVSITQYFTRLAVERPTVAIFEDLHWADPSTLEALEQLMPVTEKAPLMLLLISRPEREHPSWSIKFKAETDFVHRYTEIALKPLTLNEQDMLVDNLLAISDLPVAVRRLIQEHTEGNPFYLEEIVRNLIEQGAIRREGDRWRAAENISTITIPDTLQGILLARIDRLQEDVRRTLQLASVIGKSFLYRLLEAIAEAEQQLDQHLHQLQRVDLVREKSRLPELEYMFKHSLTQEAAYNSLLVERRKEFHLKVGEALENLFADRQKEFSGMLAHHFDAAGETEKALLYLIQAGDQARMTDEHNVAIRYYQRALEILGEKPGEEERASQVWLKLGLIYNANFQFEASHLAYESAFRLKQKTRTAVPLEPVNYQTFKLAIRATHKTLDPGKVLWSQDVHVTRILFSGLAYINDDMDVIPEIARSWQVLDDGRRYLFHLRDDYQWTDGTPVTAFDFEYAWKRNLHPAIKSDTACVFFDVVGACDYFNGITSDPESVGVRALDAQTLEVRLVEPVAYFPYIVTMPVAFPLPQAAIARCGDEWWLPGRMISNGPFRLIEFDPQHGGIVERMKDYPGSSEGNIGRLEWMVMTDGKDSAKAYMENQIDLFEHPAVPDEIPKEETYTFPVLYTGYINFLTNAPPLDDLRVRQALAMTIDRLAFMKKFHIQVVRGGMIPPGMPGHTPDLALRYDVEMGRKLLAEAGFPGGSGFPELTAIGPTLFAERYAGDFNRQWRENLGITINFQGFDSWSSEDWISGRVHGAIIFSGWLADYPDPDNILRKSGFVAVFPYMGWPDKEYQRLVNQAASTSDRTRRMAMYRQADRMIVADDVLVVPINYSMPVTTVIKPWVKNVKANLLDYLLYQNIIIEPH